MTNLHYQQAYLLATSAQTEGLGHLLATTLAAQPEGLTRIYLQGPLGAGKTTLTRALLQGLGVQGRIKSPSYALVEPYQVSRGAIAHFDFYRMNDALEWEEAGFAELFVQAWLVIAEWPEKALGVLPPADLLIQWHFDGTTQVIAEEDQLQRSVSFECGSPLGIRLADAAEQWLQNNP
jgi:tRNA threonylcarbamoyladenosine biosynthesis protein TsaE